SAALPQPPGGRRPATPAASSWLAPLEWDPHRNLRPLPGPGADRQPGMNQPGTLAHALQADSRLPPCGDVEPDAPVPHAQDELSLVAQEPDGGLGGPGVAGDVPQGLLGHAIDTQGHVAGKVRRDVPGLVSDPEPVPLFQAQTLRAQG